MGRTKHRKMSIYEFEITLKRWKTLLGSLGDAKQRDLNEKSIEWSFAFPQDLHGEKNNFIDFYENLICESTQVSDQFSIKVKTQEQWTSPKLTLETSQKIRCTEFRFVKKRKIHFNVESRTVQLSPWKSLEIRNKKHNDFRCVVLSHQATHKNNTTQHKKF